MTTLAPGMRVKCVREDWVGLHSCDGPTIGTAWTISHVEPAIGCDWLGLSEWPGQDAVFLASHFIPIDGDKELSILRSIAANPRGFVELPSRDIEHVMDEVLLP